MQDVANVTLDYILQFLEELLEGNDT